MNIYNDFKVFIRHRMLTGSFMLGATDTTNIDINYLTPLYAGGPGYNSSVKNKKRVNYDPTKKGTKISSTLFFFQRDINAATPSKMMTTHSLVKTSTNQKSSLFPVPSVTGSRI